MSLTAIGFLVLFSMGMLLAFVKKPVFGLYTYLFTFYLHPPGQWWGAMLPDLRWSFSAALITILAIFACRKKTPLIYFKFLETKLFFVFVLFVLLQSAWALNSHLHMLYLSLGIKFLLLIFIIQNSIRDRSDVIGFIVTNLIGCAYLGYRGFGGGRLENLGVPGLEGSNQLAQHLSVVLIFSAFLLLCRFGKKAYLIIPLIILILNGIILTESRTAIIAILAAGFFVAIYPPIKTAKSFYVYAGLAGLSLMILMGPRLLEKLETLLPGDDGMIEQDKSAQSRGVIIKAQLEMFADNPLGGYGHRGTLLLSPMYIPAEYLTRAPGAASSARASHNFIMALLVDHGIVGALLYGLMVINCMRYPMRLSKLDFLEVDITLCILLTGFCASLVLFHVAGLGSNNKVLEVGIWLYAIIPLVFNMIEKGKDGQVASVAGPKNYTN